jgi:hypothetical protein
MNMTSLGMYVRMYVVHGHGHGHEILKFFIKRKQNMYLCI